MKFSKSLYFHFSPSPRAVRSVRRICGGVVRDAENHRLSAPSVYWAGTRPSEPAPTAQGAFLLHRVKGYDKLVASYLGFRQRHAGREKRRRQGRVRARSGGRGAGRRRRRGQFKRQLRQARRHRQGRDDLLCGSLQDGLLQPGRVVREFGLGDRRLQRRHFRRPADQDAGAGRNLYADSRREPPDHARPERPSTD